IDVFESVPKLSPAQLDAKNPPDRAKGNRRHSIEKDFQLLGDGFADEIRTGRQHLSQLDERRPQANEGMCQISSEGARKRLRAKGQPDPAKASFSGGDSDVGEPAGDAVGGNEPGDLLGTPGDTGGRLDRVEE